MSRLVWDAVGERLFEAGVKRGVFYPRDNTGAYPLGVAWNGLTKVTEKPSGAEANDMWADDIKYASPRSTPEFEADVECYTYPDEVAECCGEAELTDGIIIGQQRHKPFGMCYRTAIGNDVDDFDHGYKLHIIYGATADPIEKDYETINENPDAITFSFSLKTVPVEVTGAKPTACLTIDSTKVDSAKLAALEAILYGTDAVTGSNPVAATNPRLPLPDEIKTLFTTNSTP